MSSILHPFLQILLNTLAYCQEKLVEIHEALNKIELFLIFVLGIVFLAYQPSVPPSTVMSTQWLLPQIGLLQYSDSLATRIWEFDLFRVELT